MDKKQEKKLDELLKQIDDLGRMVHVYHGLHEGIFSRVLYPEFYDEKLITPMQKLNEISENVATLNHILHDLLIMMGAIINAGDKKGKKNGRQTDH
jgi:hypothetical protein